MTNKNTEKKKDKNIKDFLLRNIVTVTFAVMVVLGLFMTDQTPLFIMNKLVQSFTRNSFLVLSLLIPVMAGMGFNFSIAIGAMAGHIGIILAVNWGLSGFLGFLSAVAFATPFAIFFGILAGMVLNKARGHEMITSFFLNYLGNGIYQFIFLFLIGVVIPITSSYLLLGSGVGLRNSIVLKDTLLHSVDGLLQVRFFLLLIVIGVIFLLLNIYRLKKDDVNFNKMNVYSRIIISAVVIMISAMVMYIDALPNEIRALKNLKFPLITGVLLSALVAFNLLITRTKIGQAFLSVGLNKQTSKDSDIHVSKIRITAIVISIVLASWGQIIFLQNTGVLMTYGSHQSIGLFAVLTLIVGGASIKNATVSQALLGVILVQGFLIISIPVINKLFSGNLSEVFRTIIINSVFLYAFTMTRRKIVKIQC